MEQNDEGFSEEELQLAETYQIGRLLKVFFFSPRAIRSNYWGIVIIAILSLSSGSIGLWDILPLTPFLSTWELMARIGVYVLLVVFIIAVVIEIKYFHLVTVDVFIKRFLVVSFLIAFLVGWFLGSWLGVMIFFLLFFFGNGTVVLSMRNNGKKDRLLVGSQGFLLDRQPIYGFIYVSAVHWMDILFFSSSFTPTVYRLFDVVQGQQMYIAATDYDQGEELMALLKEQITKEVHRRQTEEPEEQRCQANAYWLEYGEWPELTRWAKLRQRLL